MRVWLVCWLAAAALAPQARDARPKSGALVGGSVVSAPDGAPLRRATVMLTSDAGTRRTTTDARGRFEFTELRAGRYTVSASKAGYLTTHLGARQPDEPGRPIDVHDAQTIHDITLALPRGSAIAGRVVDEFGDPVAEIAVIAQRDRYVDGRRALVTAGRATTNDFGDYRIYGLPPGDYFVSATLRSQGEAAGNSDSADHSGYAPTFYPGSADAAGAQRITLALAHEQTGITFPLATARTARVAGTALDHDADPLADAIVLLSRRDGDLAFHNVAAAGVDLDGGFSFPNVPPGSYELVARTVGSGEPLFAIDEVRVDGKNIEGLVLMAHRGAAFAGKVSFDNGAIPRFAPSSLRVTALPPRGEEGPMAFTAPARVEADWTFQLRNLAGRQLVRIAGLPADWTVKVVRLDGADVTDGGIEFTGDETLAGLDVVLTNRVTVIRGSVTDRGAPVTDYSVVVFANDSALWMPGSRFIQMARPDQDGTFMIRGLPPHTYRAIALAALEQGRWADPDFLERVASDGKMFDLHEGEATTLNLRLTTAR